MFNEVFDRHQVPSDWRNGLIVPLHKEGDRDRATNYRGITLLSIIGKIFAGILERRLSTWCESNKLFAQEQAGFRKGRTTTDQIFTLAEIIRRRKNERKPTFCCFLDIRKAYDTVWRDGLWTKLTEAKVDGKMLRMIRNMYEGVKSRVVVNVT
jgi:sorting nexin-29